MMKQIATLVLLLSAITVTAQKSQITFNKYDHNFGRIANIDFPPAAFRFTNTGDADLVVLLVKKSNNAIVNYERRYYKPGESGIIYVSYRSGYVGPFNEQIEVMTNASPQPTILDISGNVITVEECFPNKTNFNLRHVHIIDNITKEPIPLSQIQFVFNQQTKIGPLQIKQGRDEMELKIGLYDVTISAPGYRTFTAKFYLPKSQPYLFFALEPVKPQEIIPEASDFIQPGDNLNRNNNQPTENSTVTYETTNDKELSVEKYAANNIVLLVDVSSSMKEKKKLVLLKESIKELITVLRRIDNVSLISYASESNIILNNTRGDQKDILNAAVDSLVAYGLTRGVKGLETAYTLAQNKYIAGGNNEVILATDGMFTATGTTDEKLANMIRENTAKGIKLTIIGFGINQGGIDMMKAMAEYGQGKYIHIANMEEISTVLVNEIKESSEIR